jgi:hypothetical protein
VRDSGRTGTAASTLNIAVRQLRIIGEMDIGAMNAGKCAKEEWTYSRPTFTIADHVWRGADALITLRRESDIAYVVARIGVGTGAVSMSGEHPTLGVITSTSEL